MNTKKRFLAALILPGVSLGLLNACSPQSQTEPVQEASSPTTTISLEALSNRAHLLSGGDVLLGVNSNAEGEAISLQLPAGARHSELVAVDHEAGSVSYQTLVTGLPVGESTISATAGPTQTSLQLSNYPISGPIISGQQQEPYFCADQLAPNRDGSERQFAIGNGEYLSAEDIADDCSVNTRIDYVYMSTDSDIGFRKLEELDSRPQDLAFTEISAGNQQPYIVRLETGTINRAIYQIAMLHDPASSAPSATTPSSAWNGRLIYTYGGGCEAGYFQGTSTGGVLRDHMLSSGYAVTSSTLNVNAQGGCNDVISAETTMMVKEHFIEQYGLPEYTIGRGGSGGAMQQLLIGGAYPGLLDGLLISNTFADAVTYFTDSQECASLLRDYVHNPENGMSEEVGNTIGGWSMWSLCESSLGDRPKRIGPDDCPAAVPPAAGYDPETNPQGARCSIYDGMRNIFGEKLYADISTEREFARAPHDNIGVQYGLAALNAGMISTEQFLDLNEEIGGWDIDVNSRPQRTEADEDALRIAYQTGRVTNGAAGLAQVPIIDDRSYLDDIGNFHASVYSFVTRARLERDNGHAGNYILRRHNRELSLEEDNLALMDQWLANIKAGGRDGQMLDRIVAAKPADLQDDCFAANGERIVEQPTFNMQALYDNTAGACNALYPPHAGMRLIAGGPLTNDILKCQLKAITPDDYTVEFSGEEMARLQAIFPQGVCDWSKPGVGQQINETWLSFGPSPVNRYGSN